MKLKWFIDWYISDAMKTLPFLVISLSYAALLAEKNNDPWTEVLQSASLLAALSVSGMTAFAGAYKLYEWLRKRMSVRGEQQK